MAYVQDFWKDQWSNIIFFVIIMLNLIAIFSILGLNFKDDTNKDYKKIVTLEAFGNSDYSNGLCSTYASDPVTLETKCNAPSIPAEIPAVLITFPLSTKRTLGKTFVFGNALCNSFICV